MQRDGSYECDIKFRESRLGHKNHGVLGINFLENYVSWHDVTLNTQCMTPIPKDGSMIDAKGDSLVGFGLVEPAEN